MLASLVDYLSLVKDLHVGCIYFVQAQRAFLFRVLKAWLKATLHSVERLLLTLSQVLLNNMHGYICMHVCMTGR